MYPAAFTLDTLVLIPSKYFVILWDILLQQPFQNVCWNSSILSKPNSFTYSSEFYRFLLVSVPVPRRNEWVQWTVRRRSLGRLFNPYPSNPGLFLLTWSKAEWLTVVSSICFPSHWRNHGSPRYIIFCTAEGICLRDGLTENLCPKARAVPRLTEALLATGLPVDLFAYLCQWLCIISAYHFYRDGHSCGNL